uniref:Glycoside hydrolase family 5 domain-containing protein n=1 Tax=Tetradesmus obliquus TaxID=3088 RepID=A0A383VIG4_TETOB|eukprot:jgi/Sobl393_1/801/SZX64542.1
MRVTPCLLVCLTAALLASAAAKQGGEFSPSVVLTSLDEMANNCDQMVNNALQLNAKSIKFVPTVHYYGSESSLNSYCYRNNWGSCEAPNKDNMERFTALLARCMKRAVDAGKDIAVLAHLDNMQGYTWRNLLQFNPNEKKAGYSYFDVVVAPMARAANRAIKPGTKVVFTLNGETGKSVSQYAGQWLKLVGATKAIIKGQKPLRASDVLVGISLNYNKVYGWIDFDQISPEYISKNFDRQWKAQAAKYPMDLPNMKRLYQAVDVIGVSAYPPLYPNFGLAALDTPLKYHEQELSYAGISLKDLVRSGKKLVISEWGLGGGTQDGNGVAASLADVAGHPFFGLWYPYAAYKDPWKNSQYNDYRRYLYSQTAKWLRAGAGDYKVDALYVWTAGSWDALGVHYATAGGDGSWADSQITNMVKAHNKAVNA